MAEQNEQLGSSPNPSFMSAREKMKAKLEERQKQSAEQRAERVKKALEERGKHGSSPDLLLLSPRLSRSPMRVPVPLDEKENAAEGVDELLDDTLNRAATNAKVLKNRLMSRNEYQQKRVATQMLFDSIIANSEKAHKKEQDELEVQKLSRQMDSVTQYCRSLEQQLKQAQKTITDLQAKLQSAELTITNSSSSTNISNLSGASVSLPNVAAVLEQPLSPRERSETSSARPRTETISSSSSIQRPMSTTAAPKLDGKSSRTNLPNRLTAIFSPSSSKDKKTGKDSEVYHTFGVSLAEVCDEISDVPLFLSIATTYLELSSGADLFIRSGDRTQLDLLKNHVNPGRYEFSSVSDPNVVADLVLLFFEELQESMIPTGLLPVFLEVFSNSDGLWRCAAVRSLTYSLPAARRKVLQQMAQCVARINERPGRPSVKGQLAAISRVVGPVVLAKRRQDEEVAQLFELMVSEFDSVFLLQENGGQYENDDNGMKLQLVNASSDNVINKLADEYYSALDPEFQEVIISTHTYFMKPVDLLRTIQQRMQSMSNVGPKFQEKIRLQYLLFLEKWMRVRNETHSKDMTITKEIKTLCATVKTPNDREKVLLDSIASFARETVHIRFESTTSTQITTTTTTTPTTTATVSPSSSSSSNSLSTSGNTLSLNLNKAQLNKVDLLSYKAKEICIQLTLIDIALLKRVDAEELLHKNFTKPEAAPNFVEMVEVFNKWSQWVPTEVLCRETSTQRAELLTLFIKTANRCVSMNNFNTSCAILAGLGHPSITRLRSSWEKVKKKHLQKWKKLQDLFEMARNFANYRAAERKADVPFVPYLGILPKDLNSIEENNPNFVNGWINVRKLRLIWRVIRTLLRAQVSNYNFSRTILYNYLQDMKVFGDDDVYELSKKLEPPKH